MLKSFFPNFLWLSISLFLITVAQFFLGYVLVIDSDNLKIVDLDLEAEEYWSGIHIYLILSFTSFIVWCFEYVMWKKITS